MCFNFRSCCFVQFQFLHFSWFFSFDVPVCLWYFSFNVPISLYSRALVLVMCPLCSSLVAVKLHSASLLFLSWLFRQQPIFSSCFPSFCLAVEQRFLFCSQILELVEVVSCWFLLPCHEVHLNLIFFFWTYGFFIFFMIFQFWCSCLFMIF